MLSMKVMVLAASLTVAACASKPGESTPAPLAPSPVPAITEAAPPPSAAVSSAPDLAYALSCGSMEQSKCEATAALIAERAHESHPGKTIASIAITAADGDFDLFFADGTGSGADVN